MIVESACCTPRAADARRVHSAIVATLLGAVLTLGAPPGPATAAEAGQAETGREGPLGRGVGELSDIVEVTVVNVDVVATDRSGRPADDLSRQNFRVFDDGEQVELSYFSRGGGAGGADPGLLREPLSIAFFFDNTHLTVASRSAVMDQIKDFARGQLEAGDRDVPVYAMVVAFDGELRLLQDLTTDYIAIAQGLNRAEAAHQVFTEAQGLKRRSQESFLQLMDQLNGRRQQSAGSIGAMRATLAELLAYARVVHQDSARTADAIEEVVDSLALVPGRKAFFLISDGFAARPFDRLLQNVQKRVAGRREETGIELMENREVDAPEGFDAPNNLYTRNSNIQGTAALTATSFQQDLSNFDLSARYVGLAARANSHRVSFYAFKPPEVEVAAAALSERVSDQQKLTYLSDLRGVLNGLAHDTGGRAWVSGRNVRTFFDQVAADLGSYYSLGYVLDEFVEGSIHEVRIKPRPRHLRLRPPDELRGALPARAAGRADGRRPAARLDREPPWTPHRQHPMGHRRRRLLRRRLHRLGAPRGAGHGQAGGRPHRPGAGSRGRADRGRRAVGAEPHRSAPGDPRRRLGGSPQPVLRRQLRVRDAPRPSPGGHRALGRERRERLLHPPRVRRPLTPPDTHLRQQATVTRRTP